MGRLRIRAQPLVLVECVEISALCDDLPSDPGYFAMVLDGASISHVVVSLRDTILGRLCSTWLPKLRAVCGSSLNLFNRL